jgi:predicted nucleic acid-binding protein
LGWRALRHTTLSEARSAGFLHILEQMPIQIVPTTGIQSMNTIWQLAHRHHLSAYDAAYLALCLQTGLPLATLDEDLLAAAGRAGVAQFTG